MPLIIVYANDMDTDAKARVAREVTDVIVTNYDVPPELVSLYFVPLDPASTFNAGRELDAASRHGSKAKR